MATPSTEARARLGLSEIQDLFLAALREDSEDLERSAASRVFSVPPRGAVADRWRIYREGYPARLIEAIQNDFPAVARVLGDAVFGALCRRYLRAHPPASFDIGRAGDMLPAFLAGDDLLQRLPFLADLARFEVALSRAVVAKDPAPAPWESVAALGIEEMLDRSLELAPGAAVIRSDWPVADIWALKDVPDAEVSLEVAGRPSILAVHRHGLEVRWRSIPHEQALFLESLGGGATLAILADSGRFGEPEAAATFLVSWFRSAIDLSIVRIGSNIAPTCAFQMENLT